MAIQHASIVNFVSSITDLIPGNGEASVTGTDIVAQAQSFSFDAIMYEIWGALASGAQLVVVDKETLLSPARLDREIVERKFTTLFLTTALFNRISHENPRCFRTLEKLSFGGEACSTDAVEAALTRGGPGHLVHCYGPAECTTYVTSFELELDRFLETRCAPIGRPTANSTVYVLDQLQPTPIGVVGELYIGGMGVAQGYLNKPAVTAEKFVPNPFSTTPGQRLYRTGDLVRYLPDGALEFCGRVDDQVKIRGFRIELGEIEAALSQHAQVKDAVVIASEDGTDDRRLAAYVVAGDATAALKLELKKHLRQRLPSYMVPAAIVLMPVLPLTGNGKVDREALPAPDWSNQQTAYIAPQGADEERLAGLWRGVLKLDRIGRHDNFFDAGGHSLLVIELVSRIREAFDVELPVGVLFEEQTIETQSRAIARAARNLDDRARSVDRLVALHANGDGRRVFCVPGAGGQPTQFLDLAGALLDEASVYAFRPWTGKPAESGGASTASLRSIVDGCLEALRELGDGPCYLVSHSAGAFIAYEMASKLGDKAEGLLLIDPPSPRGNALTGRQLDYVAYAHIAISNLAATAGISPVIDWSELSGKTEEKIDATIASKLRDASFDISAEEVKTMVRQVRTLAGLQLKPSAEIGLNNVHIVMARNAPHKDVEHAAARVPDRYAEWNEYFAKPPVCHEANGSHFTVLQKGNVEAVVEILRASNDSGRQRQSFRS